MKKFFLIAAAALMGIGASAANITLLYNGKAVEPGSTVVFNDIDTEDYGDYVEVEMKPDLQITADADVTGIEVTAECTSGEKVQLCCGGQCETGTSVTKRGISLSQGVKLPLEMHYLGDADTMDKIPNVKVTITVKYDGKTESYNVSMNDKSGGVSLVSSDKAAYVSGRTLVYNVDAPAVAAVYNANGTMALRAAVNGNGTLDLGTLPAGLYIYRVGNTAAKAILK